MFVALVSVAGEALYQEFMKQEEIVKVLTTTAEKVQTAKDKEVEAACLFKFVPSHWFSQIWGLLEATFASVNFISAVIRKVVVVVAKT